MDMTLRRGRLFTDFDNEKAPEVVIINETMAQTYWPNEDALGKHLKLSRKRPPGARSSALSRIRAPNRWKRQRVPEIYTNLYQRGAHHLAIFLRGHLEAAAIPDEVRAQVQAVDPTLPVFGLRC